MNIGGRNEAAIRRQSIALDNQPTYSTAEYHIKQVKDAKDKGETSRCEENEDNYNITEQLDYRKSKVRDIENHH